MTFSKPLKTPVAPEMINIMTTLPYMLKEQLSSLSYTIPLIPAFPQPRSA